jgi:hypothetical protein
MRTPQERYDPRRQVTKATDWVTFAGSGGMPIASGAGYQMSDVMPPTDPTAPASTPAVSNKTSAAVEVTVRWRYR